MKLLIEPVHGFRATVGEISIALINHANIYFNPGVGKEEKLDAASVELRLLASKLSAQTYLIPFFEQTSRYLRLPSRKNVYDAKTQLIGLSNGLHDKGLDTGKHSLGERNKFRAEKVCRLLNIYVPESEKLYIEENNT